MFFGEDSTRNSNQDGVNEVEDLVGLGSIVFDDLFFEGIGLELGLLDWIFSQRIFRDGGEGFHVELLCKK